MDSRIREDMVDRGIEKGEWTMRDLDQQLHRESPDQHEAKPKVGAVGEHNSGQMSAEASDQVGTTPVMDAESKEEPAGTGPTPREEDVRDRKVDPEAVRESFKEAELDPVAETEPEQGEKAA